MGSSQDGVRTALRSLDDEPAPDLWAEIVRRSGMESTTAPTRRVPLRASRLLIAAAIVITLAVGAAVLRLGSSDSDTRRSSAPLFTPQWQVAQRLPLPELGPGPRLIAAAGGSAWIGARGGELLATATDARTSSTIDASVPVPPISALAADGEDAWVLDTSGALHRVARDGSVELVAELGDLSPASAPELAVAGDALWVTGTVAGPLARVDSANGSTTSVSIDRAPVLLAGTDAALWAVLDGGDEVARIDPEDSTVVDRYDTDSVTRIAASGEQVWLFTGDTGVVRRIDGGGIARRFTTISPTTNGIAVVGDRFWTNEGGVLHGLDRDTGAELEQLSVGNVPGSGITAGDRSLWAFEATPELVRVAPER